MVSLLHSIYGGKHDKDVGLGHYVSHSKNYHLPCGRSSHQSMGCYASKWMRLILSLRFVGGDNCSLQVSQTFHAIFEGYGRQHCNRRRGGMEKAPKGHCSSIFRGMYCGDEVATFSTPCLEKYSAGMGRNRPRHVRPLRQCLGRQPRNRGGPLRRNHPSGRLTVDSPLQYFPFSVRSPFLSLVLQVVDTLLDPRIRILKGSRVRPPSHMDLRCNCSPRPPDDFQGRASHIYWNSDLKTFSS
jgi:hypothetical protein